jgi:integrase
MKITTDLHCVNATTDRPQVDIPVAGSPGLYLRVTEDGVKSWTVRYRRHSDGKRQRLSLGRYPGLKLKDAREAARTAINAAHAGGDPAGDKAERRAADCFHGVAEQWIAAKRRQGRSATYLKQNEYRLAAMPNTFKELKARDVQRVHVSRMLDEVAATGATTEVNRYQAFASAVFKWAVSEGFLDRDPSQGLKKRFDEKPRERSWSDDELRTMWHGVGTAKASPASRIAMRLCILLGQRPKEIAHMRVAGLKLDGHSPTLTTARTTTKNKTEHTIPLPALGVALLREALALLPPAETGSKEIWVFPAPGGKAPLDPHAFAVILNRAKDKKAGTLFGMADVQLYDARKTLATFLGNAGYPNEFVGLLLNHLSAKGGSVTGRHYNHARYMTQKREMMELWARHVESVLGLSAPASAKILTMPVRA